MKCAIDLDGTLFNAPGLFLNIAKGFSEVTLLTARPTTEVLITLSELEKYGWRQDSQFDRLIMLPLPHIFEPETCKFWADSGEIVFTSIEQRDKILEDKKLKNETRELDISVTREFIARWKANICRKLGIYVMFEDNSLNTETMRKQGIYVLEVDRGYSYSSF